MCDGYFQEGGTDSAHLSCISPCAGAVGFATARDVAWQPQNGSTDISSQNNWNGNTRPGNGDYMMFGNGNLGGDYTVTIPAATARRRKLHQAPLGERGPEGQ